MGLDPTEAVSGCRPGGHTPNRMASTTEVDAIRYLPIRAQLVDGFTDADGIGQRGAVTVDEQQYPGEGVIMVSWQVAVIDARRRLGWEFASEPRLDPCLAIADRQWRSGVRISTEDEGRVCAGVADRNDLPAVSRGLVQASFKLNHAVWLGYVEDPNAMLHCHAQDPRSPRCSRVHICRSARVTVPNVNCRRTRRWAWHAPPSLGIPRRENTAL